MAIDLGSLSIIATSLGMARQLAGAAVEIRDFNKLAATVSQINSELLKAQDGMLSLQAGMFALQQEHFETTKQLSELKKAMAQRDSYALVELGHRTFAYRKKDVPHEGGANEPSSAEPEHYICQPCFDGPGQRIVVLRSGQRGWLQCSVCKSELNV